jgi:hypothetical protein
MPIQTSGGGAIDLNPIPVVPQRLAKDDAGRVEGDMNKECG